ncbi:MAG: hypothetical protein EBS89_00785, partial [Proteobacteria bacterium]|nr:hypothetical protein [Pseudomonadota bacterium]
GLHGAKDREHFGVEAVDELEARQAETRQLARLEPLVAQRILQGLFVADIVLGLADRGRIAIGLRADIAAWDVSTGACVATIIGGTVTSRATG